MQLFWSLNKLMEKMKYNYKTFIGKNRKSLDRISLKSQHSLNVTVKFSIIY